MVSESLLIHVLVGLIVIVGAARLGGIAFKALGQPVVCGEIAAGLILGPSVLGGIFPDAVHSIFSPETEQTFKMLSQLGLILLLFLIGIDFDFGHVRDHPKRPVAVSIVGIVVPFALGVGLGTAIQPHAAPDAPKLAFSLFVGLALAITALPVLGRILAEFGLNRSPLGAIAVTAAAIDDAIGWVLLALIAGIAASGPDYGKAALMLVEIAAFAALLFFAARPFLRKWTDSALRRGDGALGNTDFAVLLALIFAAAIVTSAIGIFAIFGPFMVGAVLHDQKEFRAAVMEKLGGIVLVFFVPIFFVLSGLRTDIGSMSGALMWTFCGLTVLAGIVGKLGGCTLAARATGLSWHDSATLGVLMNARGLMALIVVNAGLDAGILSDSVFFMLVMMAVVTTFMTAPLLKRQLATSKHDSLSQIPDGVTPDLAIAQ